MTYNAVAVNKGGAMRKMFLAVLCLALAGCATVTSYRAPKVELDELGSMYVVHFDPDKRHLERIIADDLRTRGYSAKSGEEVDIPAGTNTVVTYVDHWYWDITNYMLDIEIVFREADSQKKIASGKSYRPSLQRSSPEKMIKETLNEILD